MLDPSGFYVNYSAIGAVLLLMDFFGADRRATFDLFLSSSVAFLMFANCWR